MANREPTLLGASWPADYLIPGIEPYHVEDAGIIYNADCRDILPHLPKKEILILTDPPYGINYKGCDASKRKGLGVIHDGIEGDIELMELGFILNMNCNVVSFGANNYPEQLPHRGRWICWDKRVVEKADKMLGSTFELAWRNIDHGLDKMIRLMHGGAVNADGGKRYHPTQKPVGLMKRIIEMYPQTDIILDPFLGSGTTAIAAKELGRKFIGIEISEEYCAIAAKRLRQGVLDFG
jgi:site-specific DNA-methyltransferase (adenine-specific)